MERQQAGVPRKQINQKVIALVLLSLCSTTPLAWAEEEEVKLNEFTLDSITVEAKRPDWESKLSPGTVNVIRPDDYKGEQKTLPDLLKKVPGIHVREVNGKGQYTTVTVRGSTAAQVGVFIDGVLSNLGGDAAVDISTIPIKNVERVEVYKGYIPSRFAGTFIGGVINIVTKKPTKADVSTEIGTSSYGGAKGSLEVTSPLGSGSLMFGINYESSEGDFKYKNYAAARRIPTLNNRIQSYQGSINNFNNDTIDMLIGENVPGEGLIRLTDEQITNFKANNDTWVDFVRDSGEDGLGGAIRDNAYNVASSTLTASDFESELTSQGLKQQYLAAGYSEGPRNNWLQAASDDWNNTGAGPGLLNNSTKETLLNNYVTEHVGGQISEWQQKADPATSATLADYKTQLAENQKKLKEAQNNERKRRYNDYKNTSAILKWQDDSWMVKGSWSKTDRHLPDGLWGGEANSAVENSNVDLYDTYYFDSRRQKLDNKELLVQNRHNVGKLEWGWMIDYLKQDKNYKAEHILDNGSSDFQRTTVPLREWSEYKSNKYNGQIDGTYKLAENNMLDFQMNYSHERLNIDGSLMDKVLGDTDMGSVLGQTRNRYEQNLVNVQLQDTITLDKEGTFFFTPSLRYNRSTIIGHSDGKRFDVNQENKFHWLNPRDEQSNGKATWQLALKKEFSEQLTLRMTGGTYYRLLNMYEIAGDGAGILPAPHNDGRTSAFPLPEEGKQFDLSAIWNGKVLGLDNQTTITYFWRDSENMLQLVRKGLDYWSYLNDNRGKVHGIELQSAFNWNKLDLDIRATYMKSHMERKNSAVGYDYTEVWPTFQPKWESNVRVTYNPDKATAIFAEAHYTDEYFTSDSKDSRGGEYAYLSGKPVSELLVINSGAKFKLKKNWQLSVGINDIFDKGPKQKIASNTAYTVPGYINAEFPLQGRTYYATVRYEF